MIPSRKAWPHPRDAVEAVREQVAAVGGEVLLAVGHPDGAPSQPLDGVRVVTVDANDVFTARAEAAIAAQGDIVAILEDHCFAPERWASELLASWEARPEADGVVTTMTNGAPKLLDEASFLLTWAPFLAPMAEPPTDRTPAPGVVSFRRRVLPDSVPASGWLEYELPVLLRSQGRLLADDSICMVHTQHLGARAFRLQYWAGRGFAGIHTHEAARRPKAERLRYAAGMPWRLFKQTRDAVRRAEGRRRPPGTMVAVAAMCACNAVGQVVGVLTGSAGRSHDELE